MTGCFPDWHKIEDNIAATEAMTGGDGDGDGDGGGDGDVGGDGDLGGDGDVGGDGDGDATPGPGPGPGDGDSPTFACGDCPPLDGIGAMLPSCCTGAQDVEQGAAQYVRACGVELGPLEPSLQGYCVEIGRAGEPTAECPVVSTMFTSLQGCCLQTGECGAFDNLTGSGCIGGVHGSNPPACDPNSVQQPDCPGAVGEVFDCPVATCQLTDQDAQLCRSSCCTDGGGCGVIPPDGGVCQPAAPIMEGGCPAGFLCTDAGIGGILICMDPAGNAPPCETDADCMPSGGSCMQPGGIFPGGGCIVPCQ